MTTIPCMHPDFCQSLPKPADQLERISGDKRSSQLHYRDNETGKEYRVPNIWYNQTVAERAAWARWAANRDDDRAAKLRAENERFGTPWNISQAIAAEQQASKLRDLATEMERTGKVLA